MRRRSVIRGLLAAAVLAWVARGVYRELRYASILSSSWEEASQATPRPGSYEAARAWLAANGFHVTTTPGGNFVSGVTRTDAEGGKETYTKIDGYKRLGPAAWGVGDRWMRLEFRFTDDGVFEHVHPVPRSGEPPLWSKG